ncbi:acylamino-acid-releasing enzyme, putative [Entamoeba invadens IP1]|uniref:Serine protease n=1 Tax=Entamoeba invadens TaxID=33085 RepID=C7G1V4_ENTIV|nr:acylamino-acid-releasing enzyme, putative [Entamoeba invadens IP1]ELP93585.1 acylamino-acid-releasing enzyme, putative [Entamoeba invadens IP1]BAH98109.1 serine protease [Entamoeba invadens]|eukprot:XP_004260356.1 acylamino-acid-releasing enzyme, putative [Entamoeba invadens IP1]
MLLLFILLAAVFSLTTDDILNKTKYVVSMVTDKRNNIYYIVESGDVTKKNTLYQVTPSSGADMAIQIADNVGKEVVYSQTFGEVFYTKCDASNECKWYSIDDTEVEYSITSELSLTKPTILSNRVYFLHQVFYGMEVMASEQKYTELLKRKTTSHHVFKQTPFGQGSAYVPTTDDGTPMYSHLISAEIKVDEAGRISLSNYVDVTPTVGEVVSYHINEDETFIAIEAKSTATADDKAKYQKSSIYTMSVGKTDIVCVTCEMGGNQMSPKVTKTGKYIVFVRKASLLERAGIKVVVIIDRETKEVITNDGTIRVSTPKLQIGQSETLIEVYGVNNRWEVLSVNKAVYDVEGKVWSTSDVNTEGAIEMIDIVKCADSSDCIVAVQSFSYQPGELYFFDEKSASKVLTRLNDYTQYSLAKPIIVRPMAALSDRIFGLLFKPESTEKVPVVVIVHDEEDGTAIDSFNKVMNSYTLVSEGYAVLLMNGHQSVGYGEKIRLNGQIDNAVLIEDIQSMVKELNNYNIDSTRIALVGLIGASRIVPSLLDSDLFKCAAVHAPILSIKSHYYTDAQYTFEHVYEGVEYENPFWYAKNDAMKNVANYKVPTLISYGDLDFVVDKSQPISLFQALQRRGITSRLLRFPYSNNIIEKNEDIKVFNEQYIKWFNEQLK